MAYIFPYIGNVIIPTDELIFFRGVGWSTTNQTWYGRNDTRTDSNTWDVTMFEYFRSISTVFWSEFSGLFWFPENGSTTKSGVDRQDPNVLSQDQWDFGEAGEVSSPRCPHFGYNRNPFAVNVCHPKLWNLHVARVSCRDLTLTNSSMRKTLHESRLFPERETVGFHICVSLPQGMIIIFWLLQ